MAFWSAEKLIRNKSVVEDFDESHLDTNAYNLRMGDCYFVTGAGDDPNQQTKKFLTSGQPFVVPAGQFAYLVTRENISVPANAMAFISMKTGIKFKGLINVSGFHVDPGYQGKLVFSAFNASPSLIQICEGDKIFKIWFADMDDESSEDHLFKGVGQKTIDNDLIRGMSREIYSLQAIAKKFSALESDVERRFAEQKPTIDNLTSLWRSMQTGLIIALIATFLTLIGPSLLQSGLLIKNLIFANEKTGQSENGGE